MARRGAQLGTSVLDLDVDDSRFDRGLRGAEQKAGRFTGNVGKMLSGVTGAISQGLFGAAGPIGLASSVIGGLSTVMADAVQNASELRQTTGAIESVFGTSSAKIKAFAETAADALGLSIRQVQELAAVVGAQLQGMGFSAEAAADKTIELERRGADLAATFGGTTADAISAISALLRGERDPIERYGVSLKAADVKARILALGLDTSTAAAEKNAEAVAGLQLLLEATASSSGQFARESDELAGVQQTTAAKIENASARAGKAWEELTGSIIIGAVKVADFLNQEIDPVGALAMDFGDQAAIIHRLADGLGVSFDDMKRQITADMAETGREFGQVTADMEADARHAATTFGITMNEGVRDAADAITRGGPVIAAEAGKVAGMFASEISAIVEAARAAGRDSVLNLAVGILEKQRDPLLAIEALAAVFEESMTDLELIGKLTGEDTMRMLRQGLRSDIVADRVATQEALGPILATLNSLGPAGRAAGAAMMRELGIGIDSAHGTPTDAARRAAGAIRAVFPFSEPEDPLSPLRGITRWNPLEPIYATMAGSSAEAAAAARAALGGITSALGPMTRLVPTLPGLDGIGAHAAGLGYAASAPAPIEVHNHYELHYSGRAREFNTREAFMDELESIARFNDGATP